ncbi:MAG: hypothetical protein J5614_02745 [Paludibacteraceae bacterium]|nr:hypothetical protein [Paludibacteraceae bacterium]
MLKVNKTMELRERVRKVKEMLRLSMDGSTAARLRHLGYKLTFGVTYPRLRELTAEIEPDAELAKSLWGLRQRETMLIATIIMPTECCTPEVADRWVSEAFNEEIAEYLSRNLLIRLDFAGNIVESLVDATEWQKMLIGYSLHSRLLMNDRSADTMIERYLSKSVDDVHNTDKRALSAIAFFLKQVARREQYLDRVKLIIAQLKTSESISAQWVAEEVNTFVEYSL